MSVVVKQHPNLGWDVIVGGYTFQMTQHGSVYAILRHGEPMARSDDILPSNSVSAAVAALRDEVLEHRKLVVQKNSLFEAIAHGDDAHREWLKEAIERHFDGLEVLREAPPTKSAVSPKNPTAAASLKRVSDLVEFCDKKKALEFKIWVEDARNLVKAAALYSIAPSRHVLCTDEDDSVPREANTEIKELRIEIRRKDKAARSIIPYLDWTISDESPGHHPTMPSAVAEFKEVFKNDSSPEPVPELAEPPKFQITFNMEVPEHVYLEAVKLMQQPPSKLSDLPEWAEGDGARYSGGMWIAQALRHKVDRLAIIARSAPDDRTAASELARKIEEVTK